MQSKVDARRRVGIAAALIASAVVVSSASAQISVYNGNFEIRPAGAPANDNTNTVEGWFNPLNTGAWWLGVFQGPVASANSTSALGFTGDINYDNSIGTSPYVYQSIGTKAGSHWSAQSTIDLAFDVGSLTDNNNVETQITMELFKTDGTFVGADGTDIFGQPGVTLVDSFSVTRTLFNGEDGYLPFSGSLDIGSLLATDQLFLKISKQHVPAAVSAANWTLLDNLVVTNAPIVTNKDVTWTGTTDTTGTWDSTTTAYWSGGQFFANGDRPTFGNAGAVDANNTSNVAVAGAVTTGNVVIDSTHNYSFTGGGIVGKDGTTTFTKRGSGKATFTNSMAFQGGATIEAGTVELTGPASSLNAVLVNNGTLISNRTYTDPAAINEWNPLTLERPISGTGNIIIKNHTIMGRRGAPAGENTFTGTVTIEAGAFVYIGGANGLGSPAGGTTVQAGATLGAVDVWHTGDNAIIPEPITLNGFGATSWFNNSAPAGALFQWDGTRTFSGGINLASTSSVVVRDDLASEAITTMKWTGPLTAAPGAGLQKEGGGTLEYTGATLDSLTIYGGQMKQTAGVTKTKTLYLEVGATIDLTGSTLVHDYDGTGTSYADLLARAQAAEILTSLDPVDHVLGIMDNSLRTTPITSVGGVAIDASSVVLRGTLRGDSDLNGAVNFDDLLIIAQNYNGTSKLYQQGDTNYSGAVDFDDLLNLAKNYNLSLAAVDGSAFSADFAADLALAQSLVPEPASLSIVAAASGLLLRRRRRSN